MQAKLRAVTEELERAYKNHEVQSISRLTAAVVLELAKIEMARASLEEKVAPFVPAASTASTAPTAPTAPEASADPFMPPAGYVECERKCGRWTWVASEYGNLVPECWDCWTQQGHVPRPEHAAEHPDWVMPAAKPNNIRPGDRMELSGGDVVTVVHIERDHWRVFKLDPQGGRVFTVGFTALESGSKLLSRIKS